MEKKSYSEKLKDPRWQKKRLQVMERDGFKCTLCTDDKTTLNVHHEKYTGEPWEAPLEDLTTTCEDCHTCIELINKVFTNPKVKFIRIKKMVASEGYRFAMVKSASSVHVVDLMFKSLEISLYNETVEALYKLSKEGL